MERDWLNCANIDVALRERDLNLGFFKGSINLAIDLVNDNGVDVSVRDEQTQVKHQCAVSKAFKKCGRLRIVKDHRKSAKERWDVRERR